MMRGASAAEPACPWSIAAIWRSVAPTITELQAARRRLHGKAVVIAVMLAAAYFALVVADLDLLVRLGAAGLLIVSSVALATGVMHDANHGSFSRLKWLNRTLAWTSDALGASSHLWRIQHNQLHHSHTNVVGYDADVELGPWARVAPGQPSHPACRTPSTPPSAARFRTALAQHDIRYRIHANPLTALRAHARWLRTLCTQPTVQGALSK